MCSSPAKRAPSIVLALIASRMLTPSSGMKESDSFGLFLNAALYMPRRGSEGTTGQSEAKDCRTPAYEPTAFQQSH